MNLEQQRAVETTEGRVLVLAGAGSGKTRVLTQRICHLITHCGVSPEQILGLTFTNKAAAEMRQRISKSIEPEKARRVVLSTFHSFCLQVLRKHIHHLGYTRDFSLYDEHDVQRMMSGIARELLGHEGEMPSLAATLAIISDARTQGLEAEQLKDDSNQWHEGFTQDLYRKLKASMRAYNAIDFDGMLTLTVELFEKHPRVLATYHEGFRYILIDEYQDTNPIQFRLASLLSASHRNLFVVGDDDQSIYGWRGADVNNILQFEAQTTIKLEQNYRSCNNILKAANAVIKQNAGRYQKMLWSQRGDGELIEVFHAPTDLEEASAVVHRIARMKKELNLHWCDFAILYRSNALSRQFEMELLKHQWQEIDGHWSRGIPYRVHGGKEFYERREVKDLAAYLRVIVNRNDQEALLRVINQPRRGIGDTTLGVLTEYNRGKDLPLWDVIEQVVTDQLPDIANKLTAKGLEGVKLFHSIILRVEERFRTGPMVEALNCLIETINYRKAIHEEVKSVQMRDYKWENVGEFLNAIAEFEQQTEEPLLADFITSFPLQSHQELSRQSKHDENAVNLMTIHSAKGLEFKICFIVCVEDQIIPHEKSLLETGIEEERRLLYVAMTRAMDYLAISMAKIRKRQGREVSCRPSRFLFEIPKELFRVTQWHEV